MLSQMTREELKRLHFDTIIKINNVIDVSELDDASKKVYLSYLF